LDAGAIVFKSVCDHNASSEKTDSEHIVQAMILSINYTFQELSAAGKENAIVAIIGKTKDQHRVKNDSNDLFGVALSCITLCIIYVKMNHYTDAEIEIERCSRHLTKIDKLMVNDPIALSDPHFKELKVTVQWNRLVIDTALLTVVNKSEM